MRENRLQFRLHRKTGTKCAESRYQLSRIDILSLVPHILRPYVDGLGVIVIGFYFLWGGVAQCFVKPIGVPPQYTHRKVASSASPTVAHNAKRVTWQNYGTYSDFIKTQQPMHLAPFSMMTAQDGGKIRLKVTASAFEGAQCMESRYRHGSIQRGAA